MTAACFYGSVPTRTQPQVPTTGAAVPLGCTSSPIPSTPSQWGHTVHRPSPLAAGIFPSSLAGFCRCHPEEHHPDLQLCGHVWLWDRHSASAPHIRSLWLLGQIKHMLKCLLKSGITIFLTPNKACPAAIFSHKGSRKAPQVADPRAFPRMAALLAGEKASQPPASPPQSQGSRAPPSKASSLLSVQDTRAVGQAGPCLQLIQYVC